ncbi:hypothetical protein [Helicovermis profundi]|uniref:Uncharacterized protein n=1 Tax=Helicovermis profundi TaxID=3065157 RepID=A0AAU9EUW9_9FIRM|nr:hypothetical protein HLPR_12110 [Clostridia bacterium S502]
MSSKLNVCKVASAKFNSKLNIENSIKACSCIKLTISRKNALF